MESHTAIQTLSWKTWLWRNPAHTTWTMWSRLTPPAVSYMDSLDPLMWCLEKNIVSLLGLFWSTIYKTWIESWMNKRHISMKGHSAKEMSGTRQKGQGHKRQRQDQETVRSEKNKQIWQMNAMWDLGFDNPWTMKETLVGQLAKSGKVCNSVNSNGNNVNFPALLIVLWSY